MRKSKFGRRASTKGIKSETASSNSSHFILYQGRNANQASTLAMTAYVKVFGRRRGTHQTNARLAGRRPKTCRLYVNATGNGSLLDHSGGVVRYPRVV